jgi:hypothetical protein
VPILFTLLLTAATMTGPSGHAAAPQPRTIVGAPPGAPLSAAIAAAVRHQSLPASRGLTPISTQRGPAMTRRHGGNSKATRATAIFAGAVLGSLAGILAGSAFDAMTSNGECLTGAAYGMPIGAGLGAVLTAKWVR